MTASKCSWATAATNALAHGARCRSVRRLCLGNSLGGPMAHRAFCGVAAACYELALKVHWHFGILIFPISGRFSAKLGPKTL